MSKQYISFGDAKEQIELYNGLIHDMIVVNRMSEINNGIQTSSVLCRNKNTNLLCVEKKPLSFDSLIVSPKYWVYIVQNGKEKILYGTIAELLFKQYANGKKPVINLAQQMIYIKTQEKTK